MAYKVFIGIVALVCAYMVYASVSVALVKSGAHREFAGNVMGTTQGDLNVVEFFDYSCPTCRDFHPILMRAIERDKRIHLILQPMAGADTEESKMAPRLVYAAGRQGKFAEAHEHLIENYRVIDDAFVENFSELLGLDLAQLRRDIADPEIDAVLEDNIGNMVRLGSVSTPTLLIDNRVLYTPNEPGITSDTLLDLFNQARGL